MGLLVFLKMRSMKLFKTSQIKEIDDYTIRHEPIDSFALMERASLAFFNKILPFLDGERRICIFAGPGDNGGDALVIARFLLVAGRTNRTLRLARVSSLPHL